jgi:hypothetical protein
VNPLHVVDGLEQNSLSRTRVPDGSGSANSGASTPGSSGVVTAGWSIGGAVWKRSRRSTCPSEGVAPSPPRSRCTVRQTSVTMPCRTEIACLVGESGISPASRS